MTHALRLLFTTQPGLGHFHPLVPLARAAQNTGHTVQFACAASFLPTVAAAGFDAVPAGLDWLESEAERSFPTLAEPRQLADANAFWVSHMFAGTAASMARDLLAHAAAFQPDLIVRDPLEFGGLLAAEKLRAPHATAGASVFVPPRIWQQLVAAPLAEARQELLLPPDPVCSELYRFLDLSFVPRDFAGGDYVSPVTHFLRPMPFEQASGVWQMPFGNTPLVFASLGTVYNRTPGILRVILDALRDEPVRLVLATGPGVATAELEPIPPNAVVTPYVAQSAIFPHCAAVVTHGGFNTVIGALCLGVPMVVLPLGADQPANAERAADLGAAHVVPPADLSPETLRNAVRDVVKTPAYRRAADRVRRKIDQMPGVEVGVELLERLAREQQPLVRRKPGWRERLGIGT